MTDHRSNNHLKLATSSLATKLTIEGLPNHLLKLHQSTMTFQTPQLVPKFLPKNPLVAERATNRMPTSNTITLHLQPSIFDCRTLDRRVTKGRNMQSNSEPKIFGSQTPDRRSAEVRNPLLPCLHPLSLIAKTLTKV